MTYRFSALITKEGDLYVARCPELDVTSQGENIEAARANLREAIELYLETWDGPAEDAFQHQPFWTIVEIAR
jgi:predicted RNase H-like HicB family nuclease